MAKRPRPRPAAFIDDPLWYKDAVIYQVHVKSYHDANGDGIGDFQGLIERLDYIASLGVNTIWLLPFYPSPRRDDGYDISDYRAVHPDYGDMATVRRFIDKFATAKRWALCFVARIDDNRIGQKLFPIFGGVFNRECFVRPCADVFVNPNRVGFRGCFGRMRCAGSSVGCRRCALVLISA